MRMVRREKRFPVARSQGLLTEQVDSETVIFDEETKQAHCLAPLAAIVFAHSDGRTSPAQLAGIARERLGEPVNEEQVQVVLAQLDERGLLSSSLPLRVSRRDMIQKSAAFGTAAAAATLILTIDPTVASAAQCTSIACSGGGECMGGAGCVAPTPNCNTCTAGRCVCGK
jgi:hypothetical protein